MTVIFSAYRNTGYYLLVGYLLHPCFLYLLTESYLYFDFFSIVGSEYGILHFVYGLYVYVVVDYCLVVLNNANEKYNVTSKSVDDDNIRLDYRSWRGNGGIAIFWKKSIDHAMTVMPDGNNRIQVCSVDLNKK
jgi:hypothetical protein